MTTSTSTSTRFLGNLTGTQLRDAGGVYTWPAPNGTTDRYLSVTRILDSLSKKELLRWYAAQERERICGRVAAVKAGQITGRDLVAEFDPKAEWTPAAELYRDSRASIGSSVHDQVCRYVVARDSGLPFYMDDLPEDIRPYLRSYHCWFEEAKPDYMFVEGPVFSRDFGYAGTCDGIAQIGGKLCVIDYKISARTNRDHALQLAAYRHADFIGIRNSFEEIDLPATSGGRLLLIHPDRCKLYDLPCGDAEFQAFRAAQTITEWQRAVRLPEESLK